MNRKKLIIISLAILTSIYYGTYIYRLFFKPTMGLALDVMYTIKNEYMVFAWIGDYVPMEPTFASQAGIKVGDKIVAVYDAHGFGKLIKGRDDFCEMLDRRIHLNEPWTLVVLREFKDRAPSLITLEIPPMTYSTYLSELDFWDITVYFILPILIIITAFFMGVTRYKNENAYLAFLLLLSVAITFGINYHVFPAGLREMAALYNILFRTFLAYFFMRFFMLFPSPSMIESRFPWTKSFFLSVTFILAIYNISLHFVVNSSFQLFNTLVHAFPYGQSINNWVQLLMFFIGLSSLVSNIFQLKGKDEKRRMILLLSGTLIAGIPLICLVAYIRFSQEVPSEIAYTFVGICLSLFPVTFAYVILKHRIFGVRFMLRRSLQYLLISGGFLLVEAFIIFLLLFFAASPAIMKLWPSINPSVFAVSSALLTLGIVSGLRAVNRQVMPAIDKRFFRDAVKAQEVLKELTNTIRGMAAQPKELLALVADTLCKTLYPVHVAFFLLPHKCASHTIPAAEPPTGTSDSSKHIYHCELIRFRPEANKEVVKCFQDCTDATFVDDGYITTRLEEAMPVEPRAVDVYPDDPDSWTRRLTAIGVTISNWKIPVLCRLDTMLIVPLALKDRLLGFISLGEKLSQEPFTGEDKELLTAIADQIAMALNYAELIHETAEQEKLKYEFELAKEVQSKLFPQILPKLHTIEFTGVCRTASQVSGDYYDFMELDSNKLGIALADISGKGISAALLMTNLQAFLRSNAFRQGDNISKLVNDLNHYFCTTTNANRYSTLFYGVYDDASHVLTYVNAGHNPPLLFRTASGSSTKRKRSMRYEILALESTSTIIGAFPDVTYQQESITLQPEDLLILFSDSIPASLNRDGEEFGEERLISIAATHADHSVTELRDLILNEIEQFVGYSPPQDDLTLIIAKIK